MLRNQHSPLHMFSRSDAPTVRTWARKPTTEGEGGRGRMLIKSRKGENEHETPHTRARWLARRRLAIRSPRSELRGPNVTPELHVPSRVPFSGADVVDSTNPSIQRCSTLNRQQKRSRGQAKRPLLIGRPIKDQPAVNQMRLAKAGPLSQIRPAGMRHRFFSGDKSREDS